MKKLAVFSVCLGLVLTRTMTFAIDLKQSKITEVVNDVQIISAAKQEQLAAKVNDIFSMPDVLRTGASSRAELVAQDQTITRVGANTIFSFDPADRTIDLKQGSLLFHAPHGKGGGAIHTGSATASVLGTTIIVTTTPNGGFKVIALEGEVEVKFLNGLKQKLDPGQMTFVLPGANQLAPVIIFRLDELIDNSLLVKGFGQPLQSIPLIQDQVDKQLKLLHSGKLVDTGYSVGNNATANQVEVLDINTIGEGSQPNRADATLNQPSLTAPSVPTPPNHISTKPFPLAGNNYYKGQKFIGFLARNIFVNTRPGSTALPIDLTPYSELSAFDIVAANNLYIEGPVVFDGLSSGTLELVAANQFVLTPGVSITASVHDFLMSSPNTLTLDNITLDNSPNNIFLEIGGNVNVLNNSVINAGGLSINAANNVSVNNSELNCDTALITSLNHAISLNSATLNAASQATLIAPQTITVNNSTINSSGSVSLSSSGGSVNVTGSSITAQYLTLNSGDGILLDASGHTLTGAGSGATASFTAANVVTVNNADFSSFAVVNLAAKTLNLSNVAFGGDSSVTLKSLLGLLNIGSSIPGYVNFIQNVTYGGDAAQNHIGSGITVTKM